MKIPRIERERDPGSKTMNAYFKRNNNIYYAKVATVFVVKIEKNMVNIYFNIK